MGTSGSPARSAPVTLGGSPDEIEIRELIRVVPTRHESSEVAEVGASGAMRLDAVDAWYGGFRAVRGVTMAVPARRVTAMIGPSGCGKSTLIRTLNRMHEVIPGARVAGRVEIDGQDIYGPTVDPVRVRRVVGMVFQRPNPFPTMSIFDNVAAGVKLAGPAPDRPIPEVVEESLRRAALWEEVKDKLGSRAVALSGGQQQRLCIARALAVEPEVLLMDEPCSALDPIATAKIEDLVRELRDSVTIVIVTHNLQQAARISDQTAFFFVDDARSGYLVEIGETSSLFVDPREQLTQDYVSGRFG